MVKCVCEVEENGLEVGGGAICVFCCCSCWVVIKLTRNGHSPWTRHVHLIVRHGSARWHNVECHCGNRPFDVQPRWPQRTDGGFDDEDDGDDVAVAADVADVVDDDGGSDRLTLADGAVELGVYVLGLFF